MIPSLGRRAILSILQEYKDLEVICEVSGGLEAVEKSAALQPDLVLLDIGLPNLNGLEAAREIRKVSPGSRILFLTSHDDPDLVQEALRIGALGFVVKGCRIRPIACRERRHARSAVRPQKTLPQCLDDPELLRILLREEAKLLLAAC
jgi:DNA-binding NarL/FixJ family response regulator